MAHHSHTFNSRTVVGRRQIKTLHISCGLVWRGQSMPGRPTPNTNTNKMHKKRNKKQKNNFMCSGICVRRVFNCFIAFESSAACWVSMNVAHRPAFHVRRIGFHFHTNDNVKSHRNEIPFVVFCCFFYEFPRTLKMYIHTVFAAIVIVRWASASEPSEMVEIWNVKLFLFFLNESI